MAKTIAAAIVALALGALGGVIWSRARWADELEGVKAQRDQWQKQLRERVQWTEQQISRLETRNRQLEEQVAAAEGRRSQRQDTREGFPSLEDAARALVGSDAEAGPLGTESRGAGQSEDRFPGEQASPGADIGGPRDFRTLARERIGEFLQAEMDRTDDPVARDRIKALAEYSDYMMDLWRQRREARTDEERDQIDQAMVQAGETVRSLVQEQQDAILRDVASQYGITDAEQQKAFISSLRDAQSGAFFRMPMPFWGGGVPRGSSPWRGGPAAPAPVQ